MLSMMRSAAARWGCKIWSLRREADKLLITLISSCPANAAHERRIIQHIPPQGREGVHQPGQQKAPNPRGRGAFQGVNTFQNHPARSTIKFELNVNLIKFNDLNHYTGDASKRTSGPWITAPGGGVYRPTTVISWPQPDGVPSHKRPRAGTACRRHSATGPWCPCHRAGRACRHRPPWWTAGRWRGTRLGQRGC